MPISATGSKHEGGFSFGRLRRHAENGFTPLRRYAENGFTPLRRYAENGFTPLRRYAENGFTPLRRYAENGFTPLRRYAENGFTPLRRYAENGFTLVELMVVIAILGVASAAVVLTMPDPGGRVRDEAESFAARALAARDDAIIESRDMSVWVTSDGYGIERRRRGAWEPVTARPFEPVRFKPGTTALVGASGRQRAVFDTAGGAASPVVVTLVRSTGRATISIAGDGSIRVGS